MQLDSLGFKQHLEASVKIHGHLCAGQVLGVRMSMLGLRETDIHDPKGADRKSIIVFVEMDRCATDAVQSVTGCSLGHRTMKFMDYGKMAATFLNLKTGRAVRVIAKEDSRRKAKEYFRDIENKNEVQLEVDKIMQESRVKIKEYFPNIENKYEVQLEAYKIMPDEELFDVAEVVVKVRPEDMPGRPMRRVQCDSCGEHVQDMREVCQDGKVLCVPCASGGYYEVKEPLLAVRYTEKP
jgi:formylmethanofuran dehydrogenase subunit E